METTYSMEYLSSNKFYDHLCEEYIIGCFLSEYRGNAHYAETIDLEYFHLSQHKEIWAIIKKIAQKNIAVDLISVCREIPPNREDLLSIVLKSSNLVGSSYSLPTKIEILSELFQKRMLDNVLLKSRKALQETTASAEDISAGTANQLLNINSKKSSEDAKAALVAQSIVNDMSDIDFTRPEGSVPTYIPEIDNLIHCFMPGDLIILAGRPGMGKTAFALSLAMNMHKQLHKPFFQSLEMPTRQLVCRLIAMETNIDVSKIIKGQLKEEDRRIIRSKWSGVANITINDSARMNESTMRSKILRLKAKNEISIVFVDYLQLMKSSNKTESREREISEISSSMKATAKEANIPIVLLSQLSRRVEERQNKLPQLSDLRESGSIEQDADMVIFTYRPEYYGITIDKNQNDLKGLGQIIIAKNRNGSLGEAAINFDAHTTYWKSKIETYNTPF